MRNRDKKNIMIIALLVAVVSMSVGFAFLSSEIEVSGTSQITDPKWDVKIVSISSTETEGYGKSLSATVENKFSAKFSSEFTMPGDKVTYVINVKNEGTIDAKLNSITITPENYNEGYITYSIDGLQAESILKVGESTMFTLTAMYNPDLEGTPTSADLKKDITLILDYVQK